MKFDITILVDRSGSMENVQKKDHIGGMRSFVNDQKNKGDTKFTLIQFDSGNPFEILYDAVDIDSIDTNNIDLIPMGGTPLLDAVGKTVGHIEQRVKGDPNTQVVLMIVTDGGENSSREWTKEKVQEAIKAKENDWKILYLGTNVDAFGEAYNLGINANSAINYTSSPAGIHFAYSGAGFSKVNMMRDSYARGLSKTEALCATNYTAEDRAECADGDAKLTIVPTNLNIDPLMKV